MANRLLKPFKGCLEAGVVKLYGKLDTTTSGTVDTTNTSCKGFTIAKTGSEAGRYTVTLADKYAKLLAVSAVVESSADTAYTTAKGVVPILRGVNMTTGVFYLQFVDADGSAADAELEDGANVYIEITLKDSSAY